MKHISLVSLVVLYLAVLVQPSFAQTASRNPTYRIGPRDLVEVRVFETQELNGSLRVSEDGDVTLPLIGNVKIAGLTEAEAAQRIKGILEEKALQRASVSVQVLEYRSKPISVIGAVRQPGNLAFAGRWTLLEALTAAGGLNDAHGSIIHVLRRAENGLSDQVSVRADDLMVRADPRVNIPIYPGDLINVPGEIEVTVYCLGEVQKPGPVAFKSSQRISLLTTIAQAGGMTDRASSKILVKRTDINGKTTEIAADYKRILAGKESDVELQPGDIIVVKESFF
ncbi:MAG TPA: polysaccharide biosynthesis/export family protein [Thermoanaerobaculia bacterium]|nr:polysaccharide biosynthesis/export family protein [Thermoanaerobaculia bacterium]